MKLRAEEETVTTDDQKAMTFRSYIAIVAWLSWPFIVLLFIHYLAMKGYLTHEPPVV